MKYEKCPCGSGAGFDVCCQPIVEGEVSASTAEQLMRSRYSAYVLKNVDHLVRTTHPDAQEPGLEKAIRKWMKKVEWLKLHVIATEAGTETDDSGRVEFIAEYLVDVTPGRHHECSVFEKVAGKWYYVGEETE